MINCLQFSRRFLRPICNLSDFPRWGSHRFAKFRREIYSTAAIAWNVNIRPGAVRTTHCATIIRRARRDYFCAVENRRDCPSAARDFACSRPTMRRDRDLRYWISRDRPARKPRVLDPDKKKMRRRFSREYALLVGANPTAPDLAEQLFS